jgi:hypothetical protein
MQEVMMGFGKNYTVFDIVKEYLSKPQIYDFLEWAFITGETKVSDIELMRQWNYLHKDQMTLKPQHGTRNSVIRMIELWKNAR